MAKLDSPTPLFFERGPVPDFGCHQVLISGQVVESSSLLNLEALPLHRFGGDGLGSSVRGLHGLFALLLRFSVTPYEVGLPGFQIFVFPALSSGVARRNLRPTCCSTPGTRQLGPQIKIVELDVCISSCRLRPKALVKNVGVGLK